MKKNIICALGATLVLVWSVNGFAENPPHGKMHGKENGPTFEAYGSAYMGDLDADGNGEVTWKEFSNQFPDAKRNFFDVVDTDKSGKIEQKEWHKFRQAHGLNHPQRYHRTNLPDPSKFTARMSVIDKDNDGNMNWEEFRAQFSGAEKDVFEALDLDKDKLVSKEEWEAFMDAHGK